MTTAKMENPKGVETMTKYYATQDFNGHYIEEDAGIVAFDTRAEAEAFARQPHERGGLEEGETLTIEEGEFADCWIRAHRKPTVGDSALAPFTYTDVYISAPGTHPGGNVYWITPSREILVAVSTITE